MHNSLHLSVPSTPSNLVDSLPELEMQQDATQRSVTEDSSSEPVVQPDLAQPSGIEDGPPELVVPVDAVQLSNVGNSSPELVAPPEAAQSDLVVLPDQVQPNEARNTFDFTHNPYDNSWARWGANVANVTCSRAITVGLPTFLAQAAAYGASAALSALPSAAPWLSAMAIAFPVGENIYGTYAFNKDPNKPPTLGANIARAIMIAVTLGACLAGLMTGVLPAMAASLFSSVVYAAARDLSQTFIVNESNVSAETKPKGEIVPATAFAFSQAGVSYAFSNFFPSLSSTGQFVATNAALGAIVNTVGEILDDLVIAAARDKVDGKGVQIKLGTQALTQENMTNSQLRRASHRGCHLQTIKMTGKVLEALWPNHFSGPSSIPAHIATGIGMGLLHPVFSAGLNVQNAAGNGSLLNNGEPIHNPLAPLSHRDPNNQRQAPNRNPLSQFALAR